jgi:hypothetical protein
MLLTTSQESVGTVTKDTAAVEEVLADMGNISVNGSGKLIDETKVGMAVISLQNEMGSLTLEVIQHNFFLHHVSSLTELFS